MRDYLILRLEAPLMSFGAAQGNRSMNPDEIASEVAGVPPGAARFPGRSLLTGLLANALGYDRSEGARLQALSDRVRFAAAVTRLGALDTDFQASTLGFDDRGWTTRGHVEGRGGGRVTYGSSHLRRKLAWADAAAVVALRLADGDGEDMDAVARALRRPERPLFLGRKAYLPGVPILAGTIGAATAHSALADFLGASDGEPDGWGTVWDVGEGPSDAPIAERDDRGWRSGVFQGIYPMHFRMPAPYGEDQL